jgi:hypothetical protein
MQETEAKKRRLERMNRRKLRLLAQVKYDSPFHDYMLLIRFSGAYTIRRLIPSA